MKLTTDNATFDGGYFIARSTNIGMADFHSPDAEFVFTSTHEKSLLLSITDLIQSARSNIKLCSFILSYEPVVNLLDEVLKAGNVAVFILTSVKEQELTSSMLSEEETETEERNQHLEYISRLASNGAHIRASSIAHAKFIVVDRNRALIMTANLTGPSLSINKKNLPPNPESGLLLDTSSEVRDLDALFDAIYLYGTEYREFELRKGKHQYIRLVNSELLKTDLPPKQSRVTWTVSKYDQHLLQEITELIAVAHKEVLISTYSVRALRELSALRSAINDAIKRGVSIHVFCRAMNYRTDHLEACLELYNMGCKISGDSFNHAKGILVDNKKGILFTANIDGKHGLISGFEVGISLSEGDKGFNGFKSFMYYQKQQALFEFGKSVSKNTLMAFFKEYYQERDLRLPFFPEKVELVVRSNAQYYQQFTNMISTHPIYYSVPRETGNKQERIIFEIGGCHYELEALNTMTYEVKGFSDKKDITKEKYFLPYTEIQIRTYET